MQIKPGIYLVDKPQGVSSHDVVAYFRRQSGIKRVGHAGTLDPLATGLLIILVGREFTKQQSQFLKQDKEYLVTAQIGLETASYDLDGQILKITPWENLKHINRQLIEKKLKQWRGEIKQSVPAFSAVKVAGQKLYQRARQGQKIEKLPVRTVIIKTLELLAFNSDPKQKNITCQLRVACSSGTYIRSLVHDLGQSLTDQNQEPVGACVKQLSRQTIGALKLEDALKLSRSDIRPWEN